MPLATRTRSTVPSSPRFWIPALAAALALPGCLVGGSAASSPPQRDQRLLAELNRQEQWAAETTAGRATAAELKQAQGGDAAAQADLRKRFRQLVRAAARATWVRQAVPAALEQAAPAEQARLVASFDRAAQTRKDAWNAAEEIAEALAQAKGRVALPLADLRRGLVTVHAANAAEARIAQRSAAASKPGTAGSPAAGAPASPPAADAAKPGTPPANAQAPANAQTPARPKLAAVPPPVPTPFVEAAAMLIDEHPGQEDGLRTFRPDLTEEAAQIVAALDDLRARRPPAGAAGVEPGAGAPGAGAAGAALAAPGAAAAADEEPTLHVTGDAREALRKRGPPSAIRLLPDGNFVFHYDAPARCAKPPCAAENLVFGADGSRVAKAAAAPAEPKAAQPPAPRDDADQAPEDPGFPAPDDGGDAPPAK